MEQRRQRLVFGVTRPPDEVAEEEAIRERYKPGSWHSYLDWSEGLPFPILTFWRVPTEGDVLEEGGP